MHLKILFNYKFYYDHNSDVKSAGRDALEHYFKSGFKENRKFKSDFEHVKYIIENPFRYIKLYFKKVATFLFVNINSKKNYFELENGILL